MHFQAALQALRALWEPASHKDTGIFPAQKECMASLQGIEKQFVHRMDQESLKKEEPLHLYMKK